MRFFTILAFFFLSVSMFSCNNSFNKVLKSNDYEYKLQMADKYFEEIIARCNNLEYNFERGKDYSKLIPNLKGVKCNRHIIFYRILAQQVIEIARILHEEMDIDNHIIN